MKKKKKKKVLSPFSSAASMPPSESLLVFLSFRLLVISVRLGQNPRRVDFPFSIGRLRVASAGPRETGALPSSLVSLLPLTIAAASCAVRCSSEVLTPARAGRHCLPGTQHIADLDGVTSTLISTGSATLGEDASRDEDQQGEACEVHIVGVS
jgi:hypothetical protein